MALLDRSVRRALRPMTNVIGGLRRKFYGPITHVRTEDNLVALTFDDGPHPKYTIELLEILERFGAKATFFMVGQVAARYPELVKLVADKGHAIGNHSFSHAAFPSLTRDGRKAELKKCEAVLKPHMGMIFRPPFGSENIWCHRDAIALNYRVVKWNISVDDWREHPADWIAEQLLKQMRTGSIALLHDNVVDDPEANQVRTLEAVRCVLNKSAGRFNFCTLPYLLAAGKPKTSFHIVN